MRGFLRSGIIGRVSDDLVDVAPDASQDELAIESWREMMKHMPEKKNVIAEKSTEADDMATECSGNAFFESVCNQSKQYNPAQELSARLL